MGKLNKEQFMLDLLEKQPSTLLNQYIKLPDVDIPTLEAMGYVIIKQIAEDDLIKIQLDFLSFDQKQGYSKVYHTFDISTEYMEILNLQQELKECIDVENYERAAQIKILIDNFTNKK